jgi:hypothetical protein
MKTRRDVLRLGGVAGAGVIAAACSVAQHGHANRSVTTPSDASGSMELPYLFDADPQAQQAAHRLLAIAPTAEEMRIHEQFMQFAVDVSGGNASYPYGQGSSITRLVRCSGARSAGGEPIALRCWSCRRWIR